MRRSASFPIVLIFPVVVTFLLANFSSAEANCQTKLVGKSYNCDLKFSNQSPATACFEFETGGISANFDLIDGSNDFGCACNTTGSLKKPSFGGSSTAFDCVGPGETQINGLIMGKKLSGQGTDEAGASLIYTCTVSTTPCP